MIEELKKHDLLPDIIFMDINMPQMNGFQALEYLKAHDKFLNIPVYMLTTADSEWEKEKSLRLGADGFFTKPISIEGLKNILRTVLN